MYKPYFKESSLSRIYQHYQNHDTGTISAFRYAGDCGEGDLYSKSENKNRNAKLKSKLLALGYGVTAIDGVYIENYGSDNQIEVKEYSFIVVDLKDKGTLKNDLVKLGNEFDQDSITYSEKGENYYLISSNTCPKGYPGNGKIGVKVKLGKPMFGQDGEFHSKISGRPFIFKENLQNRIDILENYPPTEIRSIKELGK